LGGGIIGLKDHSTEFHTYNIDYLSEDFNPHFENVVSRNNIRFQVKAMVYGLGLAFINDFCKKNFAPFVKGHERATLAA